MVVDVAFGGSLRLGPCNRKASVVFGLTVRAALAGLEGGQGRVAHQRADRHAHFPRNAGLEACETFVVPECLLCEVLISIQRGQIELDGVDRDQPIGRR